MRLRLAAATNVVSGLNPSGRGSIDLRKAATAAKAE
jgi:hypothetical protein